MSNIFAVVVIWTTVVVGSFGTPAGNSEKLSEQDVLKLRTFGENLSDKLSDKFDPCNDFYRYVCDNYSGYKNRWPNFQKLHKILENYLKETQELSDTEIKLKNYVKLCEVNTKADVKKFVKDFYYNSIGNWSGFDPNFVVNKLDFETIIAEAGTYISFVIVHQSFRIEPTTFKEYYYIEVDNFDILWRKEEELRYKLFELDVENMETVISDAIQFEKECSHILFGNNLEKVETDLNDLKKMIPEIDWNKQIEVILGKKVDLPDNYPVILTNPKGLRTIIKRIPEMDPRMVVNYVFCSFVDLISNEWEHANSAECLENAFYNFRPVVTGIFIKLFLSNSRKDMLTGMIKYFLKNINSYYNIFRYLLHANALEYIDWLINEYYQTFADENLSINYKDFQVDAKNFFSTYFTLLRHKKRINSHRIIYGTSIPLEFLRPMLDWVFTFHLYETLNQPSSLAYNAITLDVVNNFVKTVEYSNSSIECIKQQLSLEDLNEAEVISFVGSQIYTKGFFEWAERNNQFVEAEDIILQEYGLTNNKVLFIDLMQYECGESDSDKMKQKSLTFQNFKNFGKTFNCYSLNFTDLEQACRIEDV